MEVIGQSMNVWSIGIQKSIVKGVGLGLGNKYLLFRDTEKISKIQASI